MPAIYALYVINKSGGLIYNKASRSALLFYAHVRSMNMYWLTLDTC